MCIDRANEPLRSLLLRNLSRNFPNLCIIGANKPLRSLLLRNLNQDFPNLCIDGANEPLRSLLLRNLSRNFPNLCIIVANEPLRSLLLRNLSRGSFDPRGHLPWGSFDPRGHLPSPQVKCPRWGQRGHLTPEVICPPNSHLTFNSSFSAFRHRTSSAYSGLQCSRI